MIATSPRKWWTILPGYLVAGLCLGLADSQLGRLVQEIGLRPGWATAISVNVVMPVVAIGLAVARPLLPAAWLGAIGMTLSFILGLAVVHPPALPWRPATLLACVPPALVIACVGYAVLGTIAVLVSRRLLKVEVSGAETTGS